MDPAPITTTSSGVAGTVTVVLPKGRGPTERSCERSNRYRTLLTLPGAASAWETVLFGGATGPPTANKQSRRLL